MSPLILRGRSLETPRWTTNDPRVTDFVEFLVRRGELDRDRAQRLVGDIIRGMLVELGDDYLGDMLRHVDEILRIRVDLANRYNAVLAHFDRRTGAAPADLPPELRPAAFESLFGELNQHLEGFEALRAKTEDLLDRDALLNDVEGLREGGAAERQPGRFRGEDEAAQRATARQLSPRRRRREPVPARVAEALEEFRERYLADLPAGWRVGVRRVPPYGAGAAQIAGLSDLDPVFAAEGYELAFITPSGHRFYPDGVARSPQGGFVFLEWKEPFGIEPSGYYATLEGQIKLFEKMVQRGRLAQQIPGCSGWMYDAGQPWLNQVMTDMMLVMREGFGSPAAERLGPNLMLALRGRLPVGAEHELRDLSRYLHPPRPEAP